MARLREGVLEGLTGLWGLLRTWPVESSAAFVTTRLWWKRQVQDVYLVEEKNKKTFQHRISGVVKTQLFELLSSCFSPQLLVGVVTKLANMALWS